MDRPDVLVLDASALFLPFELGIDLEKELARLMPGTRIVLPDPVAAEVAHVAEHGTGPSKRHAKAAVAYLARFERYAIGGHGDDVVIQVGRKLEKEGNTVGIATTDQKMRFRARNKGWPVFTVKGRQPYVDGLDSPSVG